MNIETLANYVSIFGTICGLFSRVPQVYKTYKSQSAKNLSSQTMLINITANGCFLFYSIVHKQYPIILNCTSVITLEGALVYMKYKFGKMKKSSSQKSLVDMVSLDISEEEN